jgi:hypothetical protein
MLQNFKMSVRSHASVDQFEVACNSIMRKVVVHIYRSSRFIKQVMLRYLHVRFNVFHFISEAVLKIFRCFILHAVDMPFGCRPLTLEQKAREQLQDFVKEDRRNG